MLDSSLALARCCCYMMQGWVGVGWEVNIRLHLHAHDVDTTRCRGWGGLGWSGMLMLACMSSLCKIIFKNCTVSDGFGQSRGVVNVWVTFR